MRIFWDVTSVTRRPDTVTPLDLVREDTVTTSPTRWSKTPATPTTRASSGCRPSIVNVLASAPSSRDLSVPVKKNTKLLKADIQYVAMRFGNAEKLKVKCWVRKNQDSEVIKLRNTQTLTAALHPRNLVPCCPSNTSPGDSNSTAVYVRHSEISHSAEDLFWKHNDKWFPQRKPMYGS